MCRNALLLVLCFVSWAEAGDHLLSWKYQLDLQPQVKYVLNIVSMRGDKPFMEERWIDPLSRQECSQYTIEGATAETQCAAICLDPGDYSLTLYATAGDVRSPRSVPVLDVDLSTETPCAGPPPGQKTPFPTVPVIAGVTVGGGAAAYAALQARDEVAPLLTGMVNMGCVTWKVLGPCFCGPAACVQVEYWEPGWLVETSIRPGDTSLPAPFGSLVSAAIAAVAPTIGASGGAGVATSSNIRFGDVHVISLPNLFGGPCTGCVPSGAPALNYASELDAPSWRVVPPVVGPLALALQIGFWGPLYPRVGHVIHSSPVIASGLQAVRGLNIAFQPVGVNPPPDVHVVTAPTDGTSFCCQLAAPRQTPCFTAGSPPPFFELGSGSVSGKYAWIFWRRRTCCLPAPPVPCGIAALGLTQPPQNACLPLSTP
jgi:hypothetical protein